MQFCSHQILLGLSYPHWSNDVDHIEIMFRSDRSGMIGGCGLDVWSDVWSEVSPEAPHSSLRSPTWLKHIQVFGPGSRPGPKTPWRDRSFWDWSRLVYLMHHLQMHHQWTQRTCIESWKKTIEHFNNTPGIKDIREGFGCAHFLYLGKSTPVMLRDIWCLRFGVWDSWKCSCFHWNPTSYDVLVALLVATL